MKMNGNGNDNWTQEIKQQAWRLFPTTYDDAID